ncbi:MAG: hypothetical protein ACLP4V_24095 [Methylocella sp.]
MNGACESPDEQLCDCCVGVSQQTPQAITNRPALPAVAYRAGVYATFNASMLAALSDPNYPPLALLSTRDSSDFSIALLDAWAIVLDILTFYQERFANEAFLRTAVDQRSVYELARLVGYVPSPGVAASAVLAFTLSDAPGSPDNVVIPTGTRVQSVPGPGQKPQVFETSSDLTALIECNAIPAQTSLPWQLPNGATSTWIAGVANNINPGDALLFIAAASGQPSTSGPADFRYVASATANPISGNTQIFWNQPLSSVAAADASAACLYVFRKKAALFGVQAPNPFLFSRKTLPNIPGHPLVNQTDWDFTYAGGGLINLDASYPGLAPAATSSSGNATQLQWLVLTSPDDTAYFQISNTSETNPSLYALSAKTAQLTLSTATVLAGDASRNLDQVLTDFTNETRSTTAYVQSELLTPADFPNTNWNASVVYPLLAGMIVPVGGGSLSIVGGQQIVAGQPVGISGKRVRLKVLPGAAATFTPSGSSALLTVTDNQIFLVDSYPPTTPAESGTQLWSVFTVSNIAGLLAVAAEYVQFVPADKSDPLAGEAAVVSTVQVQGDVTVLGLKSPMSRIYDATTVNVNANAVEATNGETVQEILGSGDSTNDALQFTLKQSPLTYVNAPTGNGTQSTLEVWVNNLQWHEVANLLLSGPADRVFVTRVSPTGNVVVQFGNGIQGARPPTGQSNIRAVYRKGIGSPGMVSPGQLSQPLDRPQGLKYATNPSAASGAADPATADAARASAPLPTLIIGRVVSLEDYQNFALAFAGISKALATWTWFGDVRGIFLTVAGTAGAVLQPDDPIIASLIQAIQSSDIPSVPLRVVSYVPILFHFSAQVKIDQANYDSTQVLAQVWQNISDAFAFDQRQLAQHVVASSVIEIIQQTPGVIALRIQELSLSGEASVSVPAFLCASGPTPPLGAQMLLLDPATQGAIGVWS